MSGMASMIEPAPDVETPEQDAAVLEWVRVCSYERCSPATQACLAGVANRVKSAIESGYREHGALLCATTSAEGRVDSTAWTVFETFVKFGRKLPQNPSGSLPDAKVLEEQALKVKRPIATKIMPCAYVKRMISRKLLVFFAREMRGPRRADGRSRTQHHEAMTTISFYPPDNSIDSAATPAVLQQWTREFVTVDEIHLPPPQHLLDLGRKFATEEFQGMAKGKIRTLLLAFAARFMEMPMTSPVLLKACGVADSGAPRNTLRRYLQNLRSDRKLSGLDESSKRIVMGEFLAELKKRVLEWVERKKPFSSDNIQSPEVQ